MAIIDGVKNLLFDLGGVLMDLKRENCVAAFEAIGVKNANLMLGEYSQKGIFLQLEEGSLSASEFRDAVRLEAGLPLTDRQIDDALNKFLISIPEYKLNMLLELKKRYHIVMLSNTNPIMFHSKIDECFRIQGLTINDYFDEKYLSYKMKCIKPNPEIFQKLITQSGMKPEETLFFDDSQKNLEAAEKFGFRTYLAPPFTDFSSIFDL